MDKNKSQYLIDKFKNPGKYVLHDIKKRCNNPNNKSYKYYGGRGIKCLITSDELDQLWIRDKAHLMKQPSIDRENNSKNYTYNNCCFIEMTHNIGKDKRKPILQYDLEGNFIREWESITLAGIKLKINHKQICSNLKLKQKSCHNFIFIYKKDLIIQDKIPPVIRNKTWKCIIQYNLNGIFINEYRSAKDAEDIMGINRKNISNNIRGKSKTAGGYIWKYKEATNNG